MRTNNDGMGLWEISRDGEVWHLTMKGYTEPDAVAGYLWPSGATPAGIHITPSVVVEEPVQMGGFDLTGLTPGALASMEPWNAYWFTAVGAPTSDTPIDAPSLVDTLRIWFKAFIPSATIQGPPGTECFAGDNRGFSAEIDASARMHSEVTIVDLYTPTPTITQQHRCGESHEVSCEDGTILQSATADASGMTFYNFRYPGATVWDWDQPNPPAAHPPEITVPESAPITLDYVGLAANPLLPSPGVDMWAHISYDRTEHVLSIEGAVDAFPAFEGYVSWHGGPGGSGTDVVLQLDPGPDGPIGAVGPASRTLNGGSGWRRAREADPPPGVREIEEDSQAVMKTA